MNLLQRLLHKMICPWLRTIQFVLSNGGWLVASVDLGQIDELCHWNRMMQNIMMFLDSEGFITHIYVLRGGL